MTTILVAYNKKRVIGDKNSIPWHLPKDLELFKKRTTNQVVIMGRKTFLSLPKKFRPLPNRVNLILSKTQKGENVFADIDDAINYAKTQFPEKNRYIIGGEQIYNLALNKGVVDSIIVSHVHNDHSGDAYFPELSDKWVKTNCVYPNEYDGFDVIYYFPKNE